MLIKCYVRSIAWVFIVEMMNWGMTLVGSFNTGAMSFKKLTYVGKQIIYDQREVVYNK